MKMNKEETISLTLKYSVNNQSCVWSGYSNDPIIQLLRDAGKRLKYDTPFQKVRLVNERNLQILQAYKKHQIVKLRDKLSKIPSLVQEDGSVRISTRSYSKLSSFAISIFYSVCDNPQLCSGKIAQMCSIFIRVCPWERLAAIKAELAQWYGIPVQHLKIYALESVSARYIATPIEDQRFALDIYRPRGAPAGTLLVTIESQLEFDAIFSKPRQVPGEYTDFMTSTARYQIETIQSKDFIHQGYPFNRPLHTAHDTNGKVEDSRMYALHLDNSCHTQVASVFSQASLPFALYMEMNSYLTTKERMTLSRLHKSWHSAAQHVKSWTVWNLVEWLWLRHYTAYDLYLHDHVINAHYYPIYFHPTGVANGSPTVSATSKTALLSYTPALYHVYDYELQDGDVLQLRPC